MPEAERPDKVLFVIITDGEENASHRSTRQDVFDRITRQRQTYSWQFLYLGANQDAIGEAASFGIGAGQAINYVASEQGMRNVMRSATSSSYSYTSGLCKTVPDFTPDQRTDAEDPSANTVNTIITTNVSQ
jgi:hypothetical protein